MAYSCPMHPEIRQDGPGRCPKCGMALVGGRTTPKLVMAASQASLDPVCGMTVDPASPLSHDHGGKTFRFCSRHCLEKFRADPERYLAPGAKPEAMGSAPAAATTPLKAYAPLITVITLLLAATAVLAVRDWRDGSFEPRGAIAHFMAGFFLVFAGFKLMDLRGFADGYSTYDLLARRVPAYGLVYPFVELGFGLAMLAGHDSATLLWAEFAVMAFSGLGVAIKLAKKEAFQCACLGTFLKVPLTKVTLIEDFGMAALAGAMLLLG